VLASRVLPADAPEAAHRALALELYDVWVATGALDLYDHDLEVHATAPERPVACPVARWHARHGGVVTSRLHQEVLVPDAIVRWVLAHLDGTRTQADLALEVRSQANDRPLATDSVTDAELAQVVAASVDRLVACGLVVSPPSAPDTGV